MPAETLEAPPTHEPTPAMSDAMAELTALEAGEPHEPAKETKDEPKEQSTPKPEAKAKSEGETEKKADAAAKKPEVKPDPKVQAKADGDKAAAKSDEKPQEKNFKALREARDNFESENKRLKAELKEASTKLSASPVPKEFEERLAASDKLVKDLRVQLAQKDVTTDEGFQRDFYKPYVAQWSRSMQAVMGLQYADENGVAKSLTKEDAEFILSLPDAKSLAEARKLFGDDNIHALTILATHKQRIAELHERMQEAKSDAQKILDAKREKDADAEKDKNSRMGTIWKAANESVLELDPLFKPSDDDSDGSELLKKGLSEFDLAFSDDPTLTPEKRFELHAKIRHQSGAYHRLTAALKAAKDKLAEQDEELEGYRESEPKAEGSAKAVKSERMTMATMRDELAALDK